MFILGFLIISIIGVQQVFAADIGNLTGHAWMEGYGFVSMNGAGAAVDYGVTATTTGLSGYAWSEKLGWINFDDSGEMYAVTNDPAGNLCGYAWSEKVGYISFCDKSANKYYAVTVQEDGSLTGYAWSDNIGWISFNCVDGGVEQSDICSTSEYGVSIGADNELFGYAWSDNIGWISFNESDLGGCPKGSCKAKLVGNIITGWAKALSANEEGWDGWISLSKQPSDVIDYGVILDEEALVFGGYAWGSEVVGWINFSPAFGGVIFSGAFPSIISFEVDSVVTGNKPYTHWATENVVSCDLVSNTGYEDLNACQNENKCTEATVLIDNEVWEETEYTLTCFNGAGMWIEEKYTPYKYLELSGNPTEVVIDFVGAGATTTPTTIDIFSWNGFNDSISFSVDFSELPESLGDETTNTAIFSHSTLSFNDYFTNGIKTVLEMFASYRFVGEKNVTVWGNTDESTNITINAGNIEPVYEEI